MSAFRLIAAEKADHPISLLCEVLGVSRAGFHAWERRAPSDRVLADAWLLAQIKEIHRANRGVYGAPRVHAELRLARGVRVGRKRVERLMAQAGLSGLIAKKRGRTTIRVPGVRVADDLENVGGSSGAMGGARRPIVSRLSGCGRQLVARMLSWRRRRGRGPSELLVLYSI